MLPVAVNKRVVFAGLIPRLRNTEVEIVNFRPGRNPFESLAVALAPLLCFFNAEERGGKRRGALRNVVKPGEGFWEENRELDLEGLIERLKDKNGLCEIIETIVTPSPSATSFPSAAQPTSVAKSSRRLVIVADQFEELYTLSPQQNQSNLILDCLLNAVNQAPNFSLVLTLRVDFFKNAIKYTKFADALQNNNYILRAMNREELQEAIRIPAEKRGVKLEAGLLELLLDDVGEKADNLPLLEFALTQLWAKQELNPETEKLDNNPEKVAAAAFVAQGKELVRDGEVKEAIAVYNKALEINPDLQISAKNWNSLCWNGAINNHAKDVMFACEKAVALEPKNGNIIDSRGLARALTGNTSGAIKDFEVFVKQTDDDKLKSQRQSWIKDLRNGKNPFTPEVLEKLR